MGGASDRDRHPGRLHGLQHLHDVPRVVKEWRNGAGCHDISFFMDPEADKYRAYCAGIDVVQIWDIADPLAPQVITEFGWHTLQ